MGKRKRSTRAPKRNLRSYAPKSEGGATVVPFPGAVLKSKRVTVERELPRNV